MSLRELRNNGGEVLDRVAAGESLVVTRDGRAVAALSPLRRRSAAPAELIARRRALPRLDLAALRRDLDEVLDASLRASNAACSTRRRSSSGDG